MFYHFLFLGSSDEEDSSDLDEYLESTDDDSEQPDDDSAEIDFYQIGLTTIDNDFNEVVVDLWAPLD